MTEAQSQIDTLRSNLDLIQANIPRLEPFIKKNTIRKSLTLWRDCITIAKKHYPKAPTLFSEMERFSIPNLLSMIITHDPDHMDLKDYLQRFKNLLEYPQTYYDNYDDMYPPLDDEGKPMMKEIEFRDFLLKQAHEATETMPGHIITPEQAEIPPMDGKRFKNAYKKYVKEWKAQWQSK